MDFDASLALDLARLSALAYNSSTIVGARTDTEILQVDTPGRRVFACRGTVASNARNWFTDFDFDQVSLENNAAARVHHGFMKASDEVFQSVLTLCQQTPADTEIIFTGHSLGAALAHLLALRLARMGVAIHCVYTYGCPRIGNSAWRDIYQMWLGQRTFRVYHASDAVPRMPWWLNQWLHIDMGYQLGKWRPFQGLHEHHIDEYIAFLQLSASAQ